MTTDSSHDVVQSGPEIRSAMKPGKLPRERMSSRDRVTVWIVIAITLFVLVAAATIGYALANHVDPASKPASTSTGALIAPR